MNFSIYDTEISYTQFSGVLAKFSYLRDSRFTRHVRNVTRHIFFLFLFMDGNTERAQCALSRVCIPKKRKRKALKRIKQIFKLSKRVKRKKEKKIYIYKARTPVFHLPLPYVGLCVKELIGVYNLLKQY